MTPRFQDTKGREWDFSLSVTKVKKLKQVGLDVTNALKSEEWVRVVVADKMVLAEALVVLCDPGAKGVSPDDFCDGLDGDTLDKAGDAFAYAVFDFFTKSGPAQAMKRKWSQAVQKEVERWTRTIEAMDLESLTPTSPASGGPASAASPPTATPTANST